MPYIPGIAPAVTSVEASRVLLFVEKELLAISQSSTETIELELRPRGAEPLKPRNGMIVYADGVGWDPGAGEGVYAYVTNVWVKLH